MASQWQKFVQRWHNCTRCGLCETRTKVVLAKGHIPSDIVLCGEGPGASEDVIGVPFCGPAGHLLDRIIMHSLPGHVELGEDGHTEHWVCDLRVSFCNLVCCLPLGEDGTKTQEPPKSAIEACSQRLIEFIGMARPRLLVCVGALAEKWLPKILAGTAYTEYVEKTIAITHPAAVLRANISAQGLMEQRVVVNLRAAVEDLWPA